MKVMVVTRKRLIALLLLLIGFILGVVGIVQGISAEAKMQKKLLPIYSVEVPKEKKLVSVSFDAAWGNEDTQQLIDILKEYQVKATFFIVGEWVDKYPESVKALSDAGHEIQNHSDTHPHLPGLSKKEIKEEVLSCNEKIKAITGKEPMLIRVPYGDYDNNVIETVDSLNMYTVQWDVDSLDWQDLSGGEIETRVVSRVESGSIILFHNAAKHTPEALPGILKTLQREGYTFVSISQLIYKENYELDHTGKQKKKMPKTEEEKISDQS